MHIHRRLGAAALVLAALAAAGAASAAVGSQTLAITSANTQEGFVFASDGHTAGAGVANSASAIAQSSFATDSQVNADFHVGSGPNQFAFGMDVGYSAELGSFLNRGTSDLTILSLASLSDRLTLTGLAGDDRAVTLHGSFLMRQGVGGFPGFTNFADDDRGENFNAQAHAQLRIFGDGIGTSELGNDVFGFRDLGAEPGHESFGTFESPPFVDVALHMTVGQARDFSVTMIDTGSISIEDFRGNLDGRMLSQDGAEIEWAGVFTVTDDATGQALCGLTLTSQSGLNFGQIEACPNTGGGGGGSGGGTGVPEPQAWAMMLAGFGLAGASLRRRSGSGRAHAAPTRL